METLTEKKIEDKLKTETQFKSGANWFYWIAALSIINSIILLSGGQWNFVVGLAVTQIIDALGAEIAKQAGFFGTAIAFVFDILAAGVFVVFGIFAGKKYEWAFIVGMIIYALDGLLFLVVPDYLGFGFHIFALFFIFGGFKACKRLTASEIKHPATIQPS